MSCIYCGGDHCGSSAGGSAMCAGSGTPKPPKPRPRPIRAFAALALLVGLSGCCEQGMVRAGALDPVFQAVRARHDAYVTADPKLSAADKATFLRSSKLIQDVLDEAQKP
jgi:hypothetical protein